MVAQGKFVADCLKLYKVAFDTEERPILSNGHGQDWRWGDCPEEILDAITMKHKSWIMDNKEVSITVTKYITSDRVALA